jgi:hypothetical protein
LPTRWRARLGAVCAGQERLGAFRRSSGGSLLAVLGSAPEYMLAYVRLQTLGPSMLPAAVALALHNGGILGVLTLGYFIDAAIAELRLDTAVVLIAVTGMLSLGIDALSRSLRRRLRIEDRPVRLSVTTADAKGSRACA